MSETPTESTVEPRILGFPSEGHREAWLEEMEERAPAPGSSRRFQMSCNRRGEVFRAPSSGRNGHDAADDFQGEDIRLDRTVDRYLDYDPQGGRLWGADSKVEAHIGGETQVIAYLVVDRNSPTVGDRDCPEGFESNPLTELLDAVDLEEDEESTQEPGPDELPGPFVGGETPRPCPNPDCRSWSQWDGEVCTLCGHSQGGVEGAA